ncbi:TldD/PmbA family protein [Umezawaea sp.]|uniref:TldD/PmbA family protein n=1 Tax=Umezawaea sp. TaxID=1955258 RepID=UPI002ED5DDA5
MPAGTDTDALRDELRRATSGSCRHADAFVERYAHIALRHVGGRTADLMTTRRAGTSVRRVDGDGVAYQADDDPARVLEVLGAEQAAFDLSAGHAHLDDLVLAVEEAARSADPRITQVLVDAELSAQQIAVVGVDEVRRDQRSLLYLTIRVIAEENGRRATGFLTPGTSAADLSLDAAAAGRAAADRALIALAARPAPVAHLPVVVGPGRGMVLVHEACCHPLEADEVLRGSVYADRLGERIAAPGVSIVDDPTLAGAVGSYGVDDDGTAARPTTLVDDGTLASFLSDRVTSERLGLPITPNGRRDGFHHRPIPRMTNTRVLAGGVTPEDIIADTRFGLYAPHVGGGEVLESTGDFVFRVMNGYLIENGRITDPIGETTVRGNGAEVLRSIDAVGDDVELGVAKCGKFGQLIPVGVCGPTLRIGSLLVGGTDA